MSRLTPADSVDDPRLTDFLLIADPAALTARALILVEGRLVLQRIVHRRRPRLRAVLLSESAARALAPTIAEMDPEVPVYVVPQRVMNGVAGFNIHRGCLALAERAPRPTLDALDLSSLSRVVVLEGVSNPDNIGGLFRNAAAFEAGAVVLGPDCGDPYYRKAVRTSMGTSLQVPCVEAGAWPEALAGLRAAGLTLIAFTPAPDAAPLRAVRPPARAALLFGAEGDGLTPAAQALVDHRVRIEMADPGVDSLNVAAASAIALWWLATTP